jgi:hypothetical protein
MDGIRGILVELLVSVSAGPETIQIVVQRQASDGSWHDYVAGDAQAVTAGSVQRLIVGLGTTLGGAFPTTRRVSFSTGVYRIQVVHSAAGTWNYSGDVFYIA